MMMVSPGVVVALFGFFFSSELRMVSAQSYDPDEWYQRYDAYTPYCSTTEQMAERGVPPLIADDEATGGSKLAHVSLVIRHGTRTPSPSKNCWEGYTTDPATSVWNCGLTSLMSPATENEVLAVQTGTVSMDGSMNTPLFDKHFDALQDPENNLSNTMKGTCVEQQLLMQGYEQQKTNGMHFRDAYVYFGNDDDDTHDDRMKLIDATDPDHHPWDEYYLHLRSSDRERTLMSSQTLLRSMFQEEVDAHAATMGLPPNIPLHTVDYKRDYLYGNAGICPRMLSIYEAAIADPLAEAFFTNPEAQKLNEYVTDNLGNDGVFSMDCLGIMCTDRPLPEAIDDYTGEPFDPSEPGNYFAKIYQTNIDQMAFLYGYMDAEYSKLATAPLMFELMADWNAFLNGDEMTGPYIGNPPRQRAKFNLVSGHDLTILPLLFALGIWDGGWAPFASTVLFEFHELGEGRDQDLYPSTHAFRIIYNGKVLTPTMEGCPPDTDLCDSQILLDKIAPWGMEPRDCTPLPTSAPTMVSGPGKDSDEGGTPPPPEDSEDGAWEGSRGPPPEGSKDEAASKSLGSNRRNRRFPAVKQLVELRFKQMLDGMDR